MTELILIRHGETDWNRELRFQGHVDVPLNDIGHEQARRLGERMRGVAAQHLVCSDLLRTRQTAQPAVAELAAQLGPAYSFEAALDAELRERNFGAVDGMSGAEIKAQHPQTWAQWLQFDADFAFPQGESTRRFHDRVLGVVRRMARQFPGQTVVVVTHGGVLDMLYRNARGMSLHGPRQTEIPNAGLNQIRVVGEHLEIVNWADTQHLQGLPPQPNYDQRKLK